MDYMNYLFIMALIDLFTLPVFYNVLRVITNFCDSATVLTIFFGHFYYSPYHAILRVTQFETR